MSKRKRQADNDDKIETGKRLELKILKIDAPNQSLDLDVIFGKEKRLDESFFNQDCLGLSRALLGKYLVRKLDDSSHIACKIVEVEAYMGGSIDSASHSFNNKKTPKNEAMFMRCGTAYVYNIYGIYCCLNITSNENNGSAVLLRALEPSSHGTQSMIANRKLKITPQDKSGLKLLTNGPSKLCQAMGISKDLFNKVDLTQSDSLWLQRSLDGGDGHTDFKIMSAKRIGINYADPVAINSFFRFYVKENAFVSVKAKDAVELN